MITARPSYARIKSVLEAIRDHPSLRLQLVIAASALLERYGQVIDIIRADGFVPDAVVYMVIEGENLVTTAKSTGLGVVELATIFDNLKPDIVVSVADRYETIATAIAASYLTFRWPTFRAGRSPDRLTKRFVTPLPSSPTFISSRTTERRSV